METETLKKPKKSIFTSLQKKDTSKNKIQQSSSRVNIFVDTHSIQSPSQHIIRLKDIEPRSWQKVHVYKEKCYLPPKRVTVDFGKHIKEYREKKQEQKKPTHIQAPDFLHAFVQELKKESQTQKKIKQTVSQTEVPATQKISQKPPLDHLFATGEVDVLEKYRKLDKPQASPEEMASIDFSALAQFAPPSMDQRQTAVLPQEDAPDAQEKVTVLELFTHATRQKALAFAMLLLLVLPFPVWGYVQDLKENSQTVIEESKNAFLSLQASTVAAFNADVGQAEHDLQSALDAFSRAESVLEKEHGTLLFVSRMLPVIGPQIEGRQAVLQAGHHVALGNKFLVEAIDDVQGAQEFSLTDKLVMVRSSLRSSIIQYQAALEKLDSVDSGVIPAEYQSTYHEFKLLFGTLVDDLTDLAELSDTLVTAFGHEQFRRYIVVFQNEDEIRATGGFMGSFAVVDVQKGKILNIDVPGGGTYDVQGQLDEVIEPPLPLQLLNSRWEFQDSNWFPDFPSSAQKIDWFYRQTRGASSDGVIAINSSVLERLLGVMGPYTDEKLGTLDKENVILALQKEVEMDYDKTENRPKEAIGSMLTGLLDQMNHLSASQGLRLLTQLHEALSQNEIQVAFNDHTMQQAFEQFGWTGSVAKTPKTQDYVMVVHSNIGGGKSDAKMDEQVMQDVHILPDGRILTTLRIKKDHNGKPGEMFYGEDNIDYLRVYVPEGSKLIDAGGFEFPADEHFQVPQEGAYTDPFLTSIEQDENVHIESGTRVTKQFGKTVFANWMVTRVGEASEVYFTYELPFTLERTFVPKTNFEKWKDDFTGKVSDQAMRYSLFVQKQSGTNAHYDIQIHYPENFTPEWLSSEQLHDGLDVVSYQAPLQYDTLLGVVLKKNK
ncbi:DUF4012 domain-containing protein [Candidatus Nomurabacteria bacterium]|nr:DUF4012 domain-containing protein [Candidatus Nomurabacteria bacterium]